MDGIHDLGGMHGFGSVRPERDEPPFHEPWEGRVHGLMLATAMSGNLRGVFRHAIERMDPVDYLTSSYYEHWLAAVETMLLDAGTIDAEELEASRDRVLSGVPVPVRTNPAAAAMARAVMRPRPRADRRAVPARFAVGEPVVVRRRSVVGHTRCPRYVRGVRGAVERVLEAQPLPDVLEAGEVRYEPCYTVVFEARDVWGPRSEPFRIAVDLWESYLEEPA